MHDRLSGAVSEQYKERQVVFESDECFGHESEQEMLQGEGDQVETDEELIPDHDMLHCYPPAPSSSSPLPHVPHVEPDGILLCLLNKLSKR